MPAGSCSPDQETRNCRLDLPALTSHCTEVDICPSSGIPLCTMRPKCIREPDVHSLASIDHHHLEEIKEDRDSATRASA
jgi:hypothetical protein